MRPLTMLLVVGSLLIATAMAAVAISDQPNSQQVAKELPSQSTPQPQEITSCPTTVEALPRELQNDQVNAERLIIVFKRPYLVGLYRNGRLTEKDGKPACFPIEMGAWPYNPKYKVDYASTPEGWYRIDRKRSANGTGLHKSSFTYALHVSYPNLDDIDRALASNDRLRENDLTILDEETANRLRRAIKAGRLPDQDTAFGGAILLHSWAPKGVSITSGCVGIEDDHMEWLHSQVSAKDPILFVPYRTIIYADGTFGRDDTVYTETIDEIRFKESPPEPLLVDSTGAIVIVGNVPR